MAEKRTPYYSKADIWIIASRAFYFLRDGDLKMKLYWRGPRGVFVIPCSNLVKEAQLTKVKMIKVYYWNLLKQYDLIQKTG